MCVLVCFCTFCLFSCYPQRAHEILTSKYTLKKIRQYPTGEVAAGGIQPQDEGTPLISAIAGCLYERNRAVFKEWATKVFMPVIERYHMLYPEM